MAVSGLDDAIPVRRSGQLQNVVWGEPKDAGEAGLRDMQPIAEIYRSRGGKSRTG
jgi:hypothetical protein